MQAGGASKEARDALECACMVVDTVRCQVSALLEELDEARCVLEEAEGQKMAVGLLLRDTSLGPDRLADLRRKQLDIEERRIAATMLSEDATRRGEHLFSHLFEVLAAGSWIYLAPRHLLHAGDHHRIVASIRSQGLGGDLASFVAQVRAWLASGPLKPFGHALVAGVRLLASLALVSGPGSQGAGAGTEAGAEETAVAAAAREALAVLQQLLHGAPPRPVREESEEGVPEVYRQQLRGGLRVAAYNLQKERNVRLVPASRVQITIQTLTGEKWNDTSV